MRTMRNLGMVWMLTRGPREDVRGPRLEAVWVGKDLVGERIARKKALKAELDDLEKRLEIEKAKRAALKRAKRSWRTRDRKV